MLDIFTYLRDLSFVWKFDCRSWCISPGLLILIAQWAYVYADISSNKGIKIQLCITEAKQLALHIHTWGSIRKQQRFSLTAGYVCFHIYALWPSKSKITVNPKTAKNRSNYFVSKIASKMTIFNKFP